MRKIAIYILIMVVGVISITSCKASKKGCGLTSDALKIKPVNISQHTAVILAKN